MSEHFELRHWQFSAKTISDLGLADYSVFHRPFQFEIFRKIEPYLIFLNAHQLERQGADIQKKEKN